MTRPATRSGKVDLLEALHEQWKALWPDAIDAWSSFTKLSPPRFCLSEEDEQREGLSGSFAMIRLVDHAVVVSLRQVAERGLDDYGLEILAHEIGHHVYTPGDLRDNARLLARTRAGLPGKERWAPMVSNLYTDLLINDRLQRNVGLDMAGVYKALKEDGCGGLWAFYMHTYELLWGLPAGSLFNAEIDDQLRSDAILASRLIRSYAGDWIGGAGRFAVLCLEYLIKEDPSSEGALLPWMDTEQAGAGDEIPDGLAAMDGDEAAGATHPALDDASDEQVEATEVPGDTSAAEKIGGKKNVYREPKDYVDLMKSLRVNVDSKDLIIRYYRELARPHVPPFPSRALRPTTEPLIEGMTRWELGAPLSAIDWMQTAMYSPLIIPGVTTMQRVMGESQGDSRSSRPADLYLGVDCSGSMTNPAYGISYPVIAGAVITLSALRAGASVKTVLSGEPGSFMAMPDYSPSEKENLGTLTSYLGTGYAFGLERLDLEFAEGLERERPVHILLVTDADIFHMIGEYRDGWEVMERALSLAGGGGSLVLEIPSFHHSRYDDRIQRLEAMGWNTYLVRNQQELVDFARQFSRKRYSIE